MRLRGPPKSTPWWKDSRVLVPGLILGVVSSALWEMAAQPGLSGIARALLAVVSLGSSRLRDYAYESAALDPYPLPAGLLMTLLACVGTIAVLETLRSVLRDRREKPDASEIDIETVSTEEVEREIARRRKRLRRLRWTAVGLGLFLIVGLMTPALLLSASIDIRRAFFANLAVCAPALSEQEEELLRARFAAVRSRGDYEAIDAQLRDAAAKSGVQLVRVTLW